MRAKFNELSDIQSFLEENEPSRISNNKNIDLRECTFGFNLDINVLLSSLNYKYGNFENLCFRNSIFEFPVHLSLKKQTFIYDEKDKYQDCIYSNSKIEFSIDFSNSHFLDKVKFNGIEFQEDIDFRNVVFENEVELSELKFKKYIRLFESTFKSDVHFANLEFNNKSIFFTNLNDRSKFEGNVYFFKVKFEEAKFWDFVFEKDVHFQNTIFNCPIFFNNAKFLGKTTFDSIETMGLTEFQNKVYFDNAVINNIEFNHLAFENAVSFNYAIIKEISINNVYCYKSPLSLVGTKIDKVKDEGTARFLKSEALKSNNAFLITELNAKEMNLHFKQLKWKDQFFDKLIFLLNKISNNFGQKWERGVLFIFLSWVLSFSLIILLRDGLGKTFIWLDKEYLREAMSYLWQFGSLDVLGKEFSLFDILVFILGKTLIVYGIYQTIAAFRKYGK